MVSNSDNISVLAYTDISDPLSTIPTQGRLLCSQRKKHRKTGLILSRTLIPVLIPKGILNTWKPTTIVGLHGKGVNARMPLQIAPKP
jgi:hypothetical protein